MPVDRATRPTRHRPRLRLEAGTLLTVLLLAVVVHPALSAVPGRTPAVAIGLSVITGLGLLLIVLLHELGHALTARAFGARDLQITLTVLGGHTQYRAGHLGPGRSALVSLAGPAVNLALIPVLALAPSLLLTLTGPSGGSAPLEVLRLLALLNVGLAVFNLLPGLPLDGGRALEGLLGSLLRDPTRGTVVAGWCGRALAVACVAAGLWWGRVGGPASLVTALCMMLVALSVWQGSSRALREARQWQGLRDITLQEVARPVRMHRPEETLESSADTNPDAAGSGNSTASAPVDLVIAGPGTIRLVDAQAVASVPPAHRDRVPWDAVAHPAVPALVLSGALTPAQGLTALADQPGAIGLITAAGPHERPALRPATSQPAAPHIIGLLTPADWEALLTRPRTGTGRRRSGA
ncbi:site-2 protease family protein [Brachybacterium sp. EF45031]|uniref:site-2 protease family protein n=1 Tax=Brachybacterium sillae TaxID=2810536 RepID=UPI00217EB9E7|nr:site-2 protease family protein [Brachybacterium sillae]MCS6710681.1 site-2 protease family protein [Brachybacterium sillae]